MLHLLLAQSLDTADKALGLLERIQAGGGLLICLVVATICGLGFYWQLKTNSNLHKAASNKGEADLAKAEAREAAKAAETKSRLSEQEVFLREMLDRERETQEGHQAAMQAVEGYTRAMKDSQREIEQSNRLVGTLVRKTEALETTQAAGFNELVRRLDSLEGAIIRRITNG